METALSEGWQKWIIENKLIKVPDPTLIEVMVKNGIDRQIAIQAINKIDSDSSFQSESNYYQQLKKLESILEVNRKLAELSPKLGTIERRSRIDREEFLEKYYSTNTPLIITDMMGDWQAMSSWCPEFIKENYGNCLVQVQTNRNSDPNYEINTETHKKTIELREYVDMVVNGGDTNDYYMVANNGNLDREDFKGLLNDIQMFPEFIDPLKSKQRVFFWFGPAGTITPLHHDTMNIFMAHIYGRKRWRLISPAYTPLVYNNIGVFSEIDLENPDDEKYPLFKDVRVIETVLEPGEVIFVPVGWWHQVKGLDVTIALSFINFIFPNDYKYQNPNIKSSPNQKSTSSQEKNISIKTVNEEAKITSKPLTNEIVETTDAAYLVDEIYKDEVLIISFGFVSWDTPAKFDFYGRTKKLANLANKLINRILVRDVSNLWYHQGIPGLGSNVDEVAESLKELIKQISPSQVITIGQSMGAYAAIMFGQLIGADKIIAFGTLSFLDSNKAREIGDRRWLSVMESLEANLPDVCYFDLLELCQKSEYSPDIQIFYGQKSDGDTLGEVNLDDFHANRMNALSNCTLHPYKDSNHAIVKYLIDNQQIDSVLLEAIFDIKLESSNQRNTALLPEAWQVWLADNLSKGVLTHQLIDILHQHGFADMNIIATLAEIRN
ncbi:cupin-like domain-containing protein [Limnofasciculus baicalensis]|uniref:Cupin-like domain-containing protein n=1 Tax=Limnofasciculus baicalensis BBK-W-15 TaxID=2699891 RepID=A0AAE3KS53_9CYAN|nr:cupin-like domain-containing protein [Limnofasciculus baicalensis]MCP2729137.1 cupin-like domain-containing protein [Limnofasciculus baicalensis BBK-W-15]